MKKINWPMGLFIAAVVMAVFQIIVYYPLLPGIVASHFNKAGVPNNFSSKSSFMGVQAGAIAVCLAAYFIVAHLLRNASERRINLPNKDYWLAPERKDQTINFLTTRFALFFSATIFLLMDIFHQTFLVNTGRAPVLAHPMASLVLFIAFCFFWTTGLILKFSRRPPV